MQQILVSRWLFWAGVLMLVASIALTAAYGAALSPPFGTSYNLLPLFVVLALIFLLISATASPRRTSAPRTDVGESHTGGR